jgi:1-acyl-sn-glycerol-3-phosphate acyltransferase
VTEAMEDHLNLFDPKKAKKVAEAVLPIAELYHRVKWLGLENIPDEVFLGVGNHTGMHFMPESVLWVGKYQVEDRAVPMVTLIHHMAHRLANLVKFPVNELGLLEAKRENALEALQAGFAVTVYPGGDRDVARSFSDRNKIDFFDHLGYVKMALKAQVPILPIVGCGGGEAAFVINSGEKIAEWTGLKRFAKIHTWPLYWSFPFGFHLGHFPHFELPLPTQMTMSILEPYSINEYSPEDAENPEIVKHINDDLLRIMQKELDKLSKGRIPILGKLFS